jgi:hypothetical protein
MPMFDSSEKLIPSMNLQTNQPTNAATVQKVLCTPNPTTIPLSGSRKLYNIPDTMDQPEKKNITLILQNNFNTN